MRIAKDRDGKPAHLKLLRWLDILIPGLLLAQAIGRMGNRINQELYGPPTNLPWAFHINPNYPCQEPAGSPMACGLPDRLTDAATAVVRRQRLPSDLLLRGALEPDRLCAGDDPRPALGETAPRRRHLLLYLIWYPLGRFWVEMFRPDAWRMGTLATAQWIAIGAFVVGLVALIVNHVRPVKVEV